MVFVHGLGGDARNTWQLPDRPGTHWPTLLAGELDSCAVHALDYEAEPARWLGGALPLPDCATDVLDELDSRGIGARPVLFVCHSLGGLLLKQLLHDAETRGVERFRTLAAATRGIVFLATPHGESRLADYLAFLARVVPGSPAPALAELESRAAPLRELDGWFREYAAERALPIRAYFDGRDTDGVAPVLDAESAEPGIRDVVPVRVDIDHFGICRPGSTDALIHGRVRAFLSGAIEDDDPGPAGRPEAEPARRCDPAADNRAVASRGARTFRIFLASPGDVAEERAIVRKVVERLRHERRFSDHFNLLVIAWDQDGLGVALDAAITPQMAIERGLPKPSECDLTVMLAWSRMGTPLPDDHRKPDGSPYASGTEYEFLDALDARRRTGAPTLWVYRRTAKATLEHDDPEFDEKRRQWQALEDFFKRFEAEDGALLGGVNEHATPAEFEPLFEQHLRNELEARLVSVSLPGKPTAFEVINRAYYHKEAVELDRSEQWSALTALARSTDDAIALLHGEQRQNLEYFVTRLCHHLENAVDGHQLLVEVTLRIYTTPVPRSVAEWENRLADALGGEGRVADILCERLRQAPLLLVLCRHPVGPVALGDETARQAFADFLGDRLPRLIGEARENPLAEHALRVLVVVDYPPGDEWAETLHFSVRERYRAVGVRYERLKQVRPVEWEDIETYLDTLDPMPPLEFYRHMRQVYDQLYRDAISFRELATLLSEQIGLPVPGA